MEVKDFRCPICDTVGEWENVDELAQHKKTGLHVCKKCGHGSYPELYKTEEEIKAYYRKEYRNAPSIMNIYSGQRKIHYHEFFLRDTIDKWVKAKKTDLVVGEQGAAFGMVLKWIRDIFPKADVSGTELTLSYRRVAWNENKIKLSEDWDTTKKYDLIMSYKCLEHVNEPDKKLREMVLCLKPEGFLYISVPCWFECAYNFGTSGFDLNYYYSTNHIQVWTRVLFETLLRKCGLEIIKEDHCIYDSTYLCKRNDELISDKPVYEDPQDIKERMRKMKEASILYDQRKYEKAIEVWSNYPVAWQSLYENTRATFHKKGLESIEKEFIQPMLKACPHSAMCVGVQGDIYMRYNKWDEAIGCFKKVLEMRPQAPEALTQISHCFRALARQTDDAKEKETLTRQARDLMVYLKDVSLQSMGEATNWQLKDSSEIPLPTEG